MNQILTLNNISLQANKTQLPGGRKIEDTKVEAKLKRKVHVYCRSLFLNNNELRTIGNLRSILDFVMWNPEKLEWLDLSYNYIQEIEPEILKFT